MEAATKTRLAEGLRRAIEAEAYGRDFYLMAARSTSDPRGREVFERLAAEELEHQRFLSRHHASILERGAPDGAARLGPRSSLEGASPIFSDELRARIREAHFEMTALAIGVKLEEDAAIFYSREAEATAALDERVSAFYRELAAWESEHHQALLRQQLALREEFWSAGGFAPF
jgi:rubrerythrin